ncbi:hypothetical protein EJV47_17725 [Hymenobacter gummosus]|uniref:Outer membrane protein beta-barrel domain-containing protein n=1 Tax=Hymenobacter gummosus TaxID=1776032 RepID=A0A3S0HLE6_9BACT|nr:hypothetical protein [Hymenobacter gummosus]RTQ47760.1 hypothetical protein EJV47_17725 [Hymenobacter gummosus]
MRLPVLTALLLLPGAAAAQHKLRPYLGLHASGNADMTYVGPSGQLGADYYPLRRLGLSAYAHYFRRRFDRNFNNEFEEDKFDCLTGAVLLELRLGRQPERRGFFAGAGVALQYLKDDYHSYWARIYTLRKRDVLPAFRLGYAFPLGRHQLTAELNATGPYSETRPTSHYTESITQLSLGTRLVW